MQVDEEILVERVVGRRLDPITGIIYHLNFFPPETEEIASRLTQRFDDTEEKVHSNYFTLFKYFDLKHFLLSCYYCPLYGGMFLYT